MVNGQGSMDIGVEINYALPEILVETRNFASLPMSNNQSFDS
jgi:hypothetical protein